MHEAVMRPVTGPLSTWCPDLRRASPALPMVLPAVLLLVMLLVVPLVAVVGASFTDWRMGARHFSFVGADNFVRLAGDPHFRRALMNTAIYVSLVAPASVLFGLVAALLIARTGRFQAFYRTVYFLPTIATLAAAVVAWQLLLHPGSGLFNHLLRLVGIDGPNWLKDSAWALPTLAAIGIWERVGFNTVFFLAALRDTPRELLDAATLEGAPGALDRFWLVVRPHLAPITLFLTVIGSIHAFQAFEAVAILTQGGPHKSTQLLIYTIYQEGFVFFRTSYAAAATVVFILVLVLLSAVQFWQFGRKRGES